MTVLVICIDLIREAVARRWFIALGVMMTLVLGVLSAALRLDVVDGALAATHFFGTNTGNDIQAVDVAMRPLFQACAYAVFYGGTALGILSCSGFAPSMLSEGRIEHLLALPVKRPQLLSGTFLGVLFLSLIGSLYGTAGFTIIMGVKTGYWTGDLILAGLLATTSFCTIYLGMLSSALFVRSASLGTFAGGTLFTMGIIAGNRDGVAGMFEPGPGRDIFEAITMPLPRISEIGRVAGDLAASESHSFGEVATLLLGQAIFGIFLFAVGVWKFERKDF